jgi:hypothetical protein
MKAPAGSGYLGDVIGGSAVLGVLTGSETKVKFKEQLIIEPSASGNAVVASASIGTILAFEAKCSSDSFIPTVDGTVVDPTTATADGYLVYRIPTKTSNGNQQNIETYEVSFGAIHKVVD